MVVTARRPETGYHLGRNTRVPIAFAGSQAVCFSVG